MEKRVFLAVVPVVHCPVWLSSPVSAAEAARRQLRRQSRAASRAARPPRRRRSAGAGRQSVAGRTGRERSVAGRRDRRAGNRRRERCRRAVFSTAGRRAHELAAEALRRESAQPLDLIPPARAGRIAESVHAGVRRRGGQRDARQALFKPSADSLTSTGAPATLTFEYRDASGLSARKEFAFAPDHPYDDRLHAQSERAPRAGPDCRVGPGARHAAASRAG